MARSLLPQGTVAADARPSSLAEPPSGDTSRDKPSSVLETDSACAHPSSGGGVRGGADAVLARISSGGNDAAALPPAFLVRATGNTRLSLEMQAALARGEERAHRA